MYLLYNLIIYFFLIILSYQIFGPAYKYPFRLAEIITLFLSILISYFLYKYSIEKFIICLISNLLIFYIFFHIFNMVQTSPRVNIISIIGTKNNFINKSNLFKTYNYQHIIENRIIRMKSSKQIEVNNKGQLKLSNQSLVISLIYNILLIVKKYL